MQLAIDNEIKNMLDKDLFPTDEDLLGIFDKQLSIDNLISKEKEI